MPDGPTITEAELPWWMRAAITLGERYPRPVPVGPPTRGDIALSPDPPPATDSITALRRKIGCA